ncbi:MAG: hypothetical protein O7C75_00955, partial [Verrucomicrobia bacterium]|nr:hypothetical protein [Verrucomicrobiota bacterium]
MAHFYESQMVSVRPIQFRLRWFIRAFVIGVCLYCLGVGSAEANETIVKQWGVFEKKLVTTTRYSDSEKYLKV